MYDIKMFKATYLIFGTLYSFFLSLFLSEMPVLHFRHLYYITHFNSFGWRPLFGFLHKKGAGPGTRVCYHVEYYIHALADQN